MYIYVNINQCFSKNKLFINLSRKKSAKYSDQLKLETNIIIMESYRNNEGVIMPPLPDNIDW